VELSTLAPYHALTLINGRRAASPMAADLPLEAPQFDTYFVYPEELKETKRVTAFRDFIVSKAKEWSF
jgi:hypothetical protein